MTTSKVTVREMTEYDIPEIVALGGMMHDESQYRVLEFAPEEVAAMCYKAIDDYSMLAIVAEVDGKIVGMVGAYMTRYQYGYALVAQDHVVYVHPDHRGSLAFYKMIVNYVTWARQKGAEMVFVAQTTGENQEKIEQLYTRIGFEKVGSLYRI